jgi:hypothetical protein
MGQSSTAAVEGKLAGAGLLAVELVDVRPARSRLAAVTTLHPE